MSNLSSNDSMLAIKSVWGQNRTFRLMPLDGGCPYLECIYDPETKILVVISKTSKQSYHMLPQLDENGDAVPAKRPRANGKNVREERRLLDTYQEYYIITNEEIYDFVKRVCVNKDFDFATFIEASPIMGASEAAGISTGVITE